MKDERVFIIAPNYGLAEHYAKKHNIQRKDFRCVNEQSDLYGLKDVLVLWVENDKSGSFDFDQKHWEIIEIARQLRDSGRIKVKIVAMEEDYRE